MIQMNEPKFEPFNALGYICLKTNVLFYFFIATNAN